MTSTTSSFVLKDLTNVHCNTTSDYGFGIWLPTVCKKYRSSNIQRFPNTSKPKKYL